MFEPVTDRKYLVGKKSAPPKPKPIAMKPFSDIKLNPGQHTRVAFQSYCDRLPKAENFPDLAKTTDKEAIEAAIRENIHLSLVVLRIGDDQWYSHRFSAKHRTVQGLYVGKNIKVHERPEDEAAVQTIVDVLNSATHIDTWKSYEWGYSVLAHYLTSEQDILDWRHKTRDVSTEIWFQDRCAPTVPLLRSWNKLPLMALEPCIDDQYLAQLVLAVDDINALKQVVFHKSSRVQAANQKRGVDYSPKPVVFVPTW